MKINVNDMSCKHCVAKIQKELLIKGLKFQIKLEEKIVEVAEIDKEKALQAIQTAGYNPTV